MLASKQGQASVLLLAPPSYSTTALRVTTAFAQVNISTQRASPRLIKLGAVSRVHRAWHERVFGGPLRALPSFTSGSARRLAFVAATYAWRLRRQSKRAQGAMDTGDGRAAKSSRWEVPCKRGSRRRAVSGRDGRL